MAGKPQIKRRARTKASTRQSKSAPRGKRSGVKAINLALQGGGAHGAFTWGVLDRILEDSRLSIEAITGTSAGAMNGAVLIQGMLDGGPERARQRLREFWYKVSMVASLSPLQPSPLEKFLGQNSLGHSPSFFAMDFFTRIFSPYQYNIFDLNPLRTIVNELVDFEAVRANTSIKLFANATNVRTGKIKVFKTDEMTIDMIMASACLPFMFKTVYVDGEPYWDGGYSGNPALYPLFYHCASEDTIIVQINPLNVESVPTHALEIMDRVNEISFNTTLMREMRAIAFVKHLLREHKISESRYTDVKVHLIESEELMTSIGATSKYNADWDFLQYLHDVGYQSASDWLDAHFDDIGKRSSIDIEATYL